MLLVQGQIPFHFLAVPQCLFSTFLQGHMVPYDQPERSLAMIRAFTRGESLFDGMQIPDALPEQKSIQAEQ